MSKCQHIWLFHCKRRLHAINMNRFTNTKLTCMHFVYVIANRNRRFCCGAVISRKISNGVPTKLSNVQSRTSQSFGTWILHNNAAGYQAATNSINAHLGIGSVVCCAPKYQNQSTGSFICYRNVSINCLVSVASSHISFDLVIPSQTFANFLVLLCLVMKQPFNVSGNSIRTTSTHALQTTYLDPAHETHNSVSLLMCGLCNPDIHLTTSTGRSQVPHISSGGYSGNA